MSEIRQCWAYNVKGQRCEHPAGHPGNHVIMAEWSDDECFSPIGTAGDNGAGSALLPKMPPPPPPPASNKCVACQHQHRGGECKCGCYEFIG